MKEENGWQDQIDQTQEQSAKADPQTGSLLFQRLPQEMRDYVYALVFSSTRLMSDYINTMMPSSEPNGLALLRACRRAKLEIGNSWLLYVLFCFRRGEDMLDKLSALPADTLSKIRHMRINGAPIHFRRPIGHEPRRDRFDYDYFEYRLASVFKLLPGLQLDQLTVVDGNDETDCYRSLNSFIEEGNGWKALRYITHNSKVLGFKVSSTFGPWRRPQPMHWQMVMESRDGAASNPLVTVYRAQQPTQVPRAGYGWILDPNMRVKFEQKSREGQDLRPDVLPEDSELMTGDEQWKAMLVIVERGSGADYEQKKGSPPAPLDKSDMRRDFRGMTWEQIKDTCEISKECIGRICFYSNSRESDL
ncbi:uncharacterized protein B0H64DRAFT_327879 [Chaetomium fimeti]|uniref:Uncharacterized protein n=1 Tax=Chaetomium fimeti TaxID=1854472 RepID=A0AAE0HAW0_9PEZI|nr:hypothetical protein B0H64DRAFT_327879 [Chaetomium fimeti]